MDIFDELGSCRCPFGNLEAGWWWWRSKWVVGYILVHFEMECFIVCLEHFLGT